MSQDEGEDLERLLILVAGPWAESFRLLVSLWPQAAKSAGAAQRLKRWAELSGLPPSEVHRLSGPLLSGEICRADGTVDPEAALIVRGAFGAALEALEARQKRRKTGGS